MHEDAERFVRAVRSKDSRFDGWFFTAVLTTRIYCRPDATPGSPARNERTDLVARAMGTWWRRR